MTNQQIASSPEKPPVGQPARPIPEKPPPIRKARQGDFGAADTKRNVWHLVAAVDVTIDDICRDIYWEAVAHFLRPGDRVEVYWEDHSRYVELIVRAVGKGGARMFVRTDLAMTDDVSLAASLDVRWNSARHVFDVVRRADRVVIQSGFALREQATAWAVRHTEVMAEVPAA